MRAPSLNTILFTCEGSPRRLGEQGGGGDGPETKTFPPSCQFYDQPNFSQLGFSPT